MEEVWKQFLLARDRWLGTKGWEEAHHQGLLWTTTNTFLLSEQTNWLFENYLFHQELVCWRWRKSGNERHQCGNLTHWRSANIATLDKNHHRHEKMKMKIHFHFSIFKEGLVHFWSDIHVQKLKPRWNWFLIFYYKTPIGADRAVQEEQSTCQNLFLNHINNQKPYLQKIKIFLHLLRKYNRLKNYLL